jgi:hypothetical protein
MSRIRDRVVCHFTWTVAVQPLAITLFLGAGFVFGLLTYRHRHLFGEGPPDPSRPDLTDGLKGRAFWVTVCTFLWPLQLVSGLHGLWRVRAARRP